MACSCVSSAHDSGKAEITCLSGTGGARIPLHCRRGRSELENRQLGIARKLSEVRFYVNTRCTLVTKSEHPCLSHRGIHTVGLSAIFRITRCQPSQGRVQPATSYSVGDSE